MTEGTMGVSLLDTDEMIAAYPGGLVVIRTCRNADDLVIEPAVIREDAVAVYGRGSHDCLAVIDLAEMGPILFAEWR